MDDGSWVTGHRGCAHTLGTTQASLAVELDSAGHQQTLGVKV